MGSAVIDPTAAAMLALQLRALAGLEGWPPAAMLGERAADALRGGPGLSMADGMRLARWSTTWRRTDPEVRAFYRTALLIPSLSEHDRAAVEAGLSALLTGRQASAVSRGRIQRLHGEITGRDAGRDLTAPPRKRLLRMPTNQTGGRDE